MHKNMDTEPHFQFTDRKDCSYHYTVLKLCPFEVSIVNFMLPRNLKMYIR